MLDWLAGTGCSRLAIHFDVDTVDSNEIVLGLGAEPNGLTSAQARRVVDDLDAVADVVGLTIAEFIPRQVMHVQQLLAGFRCFAVDSIRGQREPVALDRLRPLYSATKSDRSVIEFRECLTRRRQDAIAVVRVDAASRAPGYCAKGGAR